MWKNTKRKKLMDNRSLMCPYIKCVNGKVIFDKQTKWQRKGSAVNCTCSHNFLVVIPKMAKHNRKYLGGIRLFIYIIFFLHTVCLSQSICSGMIVIDSHPQ